MIEPAQNKQQMNREPPETTMDVPWSWKQTWMGIVLTVIPWMALAIALMNTGNGTTTGNNAPVPLAIDVVNAIITLIFSALVEGAFLIAPLTIANRVYRAIKPHARLALTALGFRAFSVRRAAVLIVSFMVLIFVVNILYASLITTFHLNLQTNDQTILARSKQLPITTYATLFVAVFVAPFCEEVFFRGFVFPGLRLKMPIAPAIIVSALLFAIAHVDPGSFAVLLVIGLLLGYVRWRTSSIWPGMLLHMLNNGIGAVSILLVMWGVVKA